MASNHYKGVLRHFTIREETIDTVQLVPKMTFKVFCLLTHFVIIIYLISVCTIENRKICSLLICGDSYTLPPSCVKMA